jgi:hypothetical protein
MKLGRAAAMRWMRVFISQKSGQGTRDTGHERQRARQDQQDLHDKSSEHGTRKTEYILTQRRQDAKVRGQKSEVRGQCLTQRRKGANVRGQHRNGTRKSQRSEVGSQKSVSHAKTPSIETGDRRSEVSINGRDQRSEVGQRPTDDRFAWTRDA